MLTNNEKDLKGELPILCNRECVDESMIKIYKSIRPLVDEAMKEGLWRNVHDYGNFLIFLHYWLINERHPEFDNKTCFEMCCETAKAEDQKVILKVLKSYNNYLCNKNKSVI